MRYEDEGSQRETVVPVFVFFLFRFLFFSRERVCVGLERESSEGGDKKGEIEVEIDR